MNSPELQHHFSYLIDKTRTGMGDSDAHLLPLFAIALASKGKIFVELGVRKGITTLPLLLAAHLNGGMLYSVDIQDTEFECPPELSPHWRFIRSDALSFLRNWDPTRVMDIVFVDDLHTYPHVAAELDYISRYTTARSIIALHDLMYGGYEPRYHSNPAMWKGEWAYGGPYRAVHSLKRSKWEWATLPWYSGLTLLRKTLAPHNESRIKIWTKRILRLISHKLERSVNHHYQLIKKRLTHHA